MRLLSFGLSVGLVVSLMACGGDETEADPSTVPTPSTAGSMTVPAAATTASPSLAVIPDDPQVVAGTGTCEVFEDEGVAADGTPGPVWVCELQMSDPRVSGTQTDDGMRPMDGGAEGFVWMFENSTITNEDGTWRGRNQAADNAVPCGEGHYVGEDAYEGLEFHVYFCGVGPATYRGWISATG
jgi:hypothetical protein